MVFLRSASADIHRRSYWLVLKTHFSIKETLLKTCLPEIHISFILGDFNREIELYESLMFILQEIQFVEAEHGQTFTQHRIRISNKGNKRI